MRLEKIIIGAISGIIAAAVAIFVFQPLKDGSNDIDNSYSNQQKFQYEQSRREDEIRKENLLREQEKQLAEARRIELERQLAEERRIEQERLLTEARRDYYNSVNYRNNNPTDNNKSSGTSKAGIDNHVRNFINDARSYHQ